MLFALHQLMALSIYAGSAAIFGAAVLSSRAWHSQLERWLLSTVLGVGLIAQGLFILGICGGLQPWTIYGVLALGHLLCWRQWRDCWRQWRALRQALIDLPAALPLLVLLVLLVLLALPLVALALYPPTGFDAAVYHLPYVEHFLAEGRLVFAADLRFPIFPQVGEMGFVLGFVLAGDVAAQLTQVLATLLTAGLIYRWGQLGGNQRIGLWASALWLGVPLVMWIGSQAYVDVGLTMFVAAAWFSWDRWRGDGADDGQGDGAIFWCGLAGAFAGLAAGTKYLGLFFVAALGVAICWRTWQRRELKPIVWFTFGALVFLAPWYLRLMVVTGNPLFPFYSQLFGSNEWVSLHDQNLAAQAASGSGGFFSALLERMTSGLGFLLATPWTGVFERDVFHRQAPLTPFYLVLLPLCLPVALWTSRINRWRGLLVLAYCVFWLTTVRDLRFLLPILPPLHLILCSGLDDWCQKIRFSKTRITQDGRGPRWLTTMALAIALVLPGWGYACYKLVGKGALPTQSAARQAYLAAKIPGVSLVQQLNSLQGNSYTLYALFAERLNYFADGRFLGDRFGPHAFEQILPALASGDRLFKELRSKDACFFLVRHGGKARLPEDAEFERRFHSLERADGFELFALEDPACPPTASPAALPNF